MQNNKGLKSFGRAIDLIGPYQGGGLFVMRAWGAANGIVTNSGSSTGATIVTINGEIIAATAGFLSLRSKSPRPPAFYRVTSATLSL